MRKYLFTESQVKKVVDNVIKEQTDNRILTATVQCFLNHPKVMNAKLGIDGKTGPNSLTEKALMKFQQKKGVTPDGVWGYRTQETLTPEEANIWAGCRKYFETYR